MSTSDNIQAVAALHESAPYDSGGALREEIKALLVDQNAVLVAHYYTDEAIQALAEETGGCVADSLEMARFGAASDAETIVVAGVRFMGETAKILSPEKRVLMPTLEATCSLDIGCDPVAFSAFCDQHPERTVVVYANTSAEVKARADWVVTSSIAVDVVEHLMDQGESILWAPDKHLGSYIREKTGADMLLWDGACIVHDEFKAQGLRELKAVHPHAVVLVHPESPKGVVDQADVAVAFEHVHLGIGNARGHELRLGHRGHQLVAVACEEQRGRRALEVLTLPREELERALPEPAARVGQPVVEQEAEADAVARAAVDRAHPGRRRRHLRGRGGAQADPAAARRTLRHGDRQSCHRGA